MWRLDRLARNLRHQLETIDSLAEEKATIVTADGNVDLSSPVGQAMASMSGIFAELEAKNISERTTAARAHLLRAGRSSGGVAPFGFRNVPNPDGPGVVRAHDPATIDTLRQMVRRAQDGQTIYQIKEWLHAEGIKGNRGGDFTYNACRAAIAHPIVAGLTSHNPGNKSKERGSDVVRDSDGLRLVDESLKILPLAEWDALCDRLAEKATTGPRMPRASRRLTSPLLAGLVVCDPCDRKMTRGRFDGRAGYNCPICRQTITGLDRLVIEEFLYQKGERVRWTRVTVRYVDGGVLPELERRIEELGQAITEASAAERATLRAEQDRLLDMRDEKRATTRQTEVVAEPAGWFEDDWAAAGDDVLAQRAVLEDALVQVRVKRGAKGGRGDSLKKPRLVYVWKQPEDLGPVPTEAPEGWDPSWDPHAS